MDRESRRVGYGRGKMQERGSSRRSRPIETQDKFRALRDCLEWNSDGRYIANRGKEEYRVASGYDCSNFRCRRRGVAGTISLRYPSEVVSKRFDHWRMNASFIDYLYHRSDPVVIPRIFRSFARLAAQASLTPGVNRLQPYRLNC